MEEAIKTTPIDDKRIMVEGKVYPQRDLFMNVCALFKMKDSKTIECVRIGEGGIKDIQEVDNNTFIIESD